MALRTFVLYCSYYAILSHLADSSEEVWNDQNEEDTEGFEPTSSAAEIPSPPEVAISISHVSQGRQLHYCSG